MFRFITLLIVTMLTLAVSSNGSAGIADGLTFIVEPSRDPGQLHVRFSSAGRNVTSWSDSMPAGSLAGFDVARFAAPGSGPLRLAIVREAGRLDCAGTGGNRRATGSCRFTADPGFSAFLASNGIGRPGPDQAFSLMAINARRAVVTALIGAGYPRPTLDNLVPLIAVGVDGPYIARLAAAGYRPETLEGLLQFKALGITPDYIRTFRQLGYDQRRAGDLVQLKALGIDGDFIAGFERIGYRRLPASELIQLKALGVTPHDVLSLRGRGYRDLSVGKLVQIKALGLAPGDTRRADRRSRAR